MNYSACQAESIDTYSDDESSCLFPPQSQLSCSLPNLLLGFWENEWYIWSSLGELYQNQS